MFFSNTKNGPKYKNLTLHPNLTKKAVKENLKRQITLPKIDYKQSHKILGITLDTKLSFVQHLENIKHSMRSDVCSLRLLKDTNIQTKTLLAKTRLQPKLTYSYPINQLLSPNQKLIYQQCQNYALYKFTLSHIPYQHKPNAEELHVKLKLKCIAQIAWERCKKIHKSLSKELPQFYDLFCAYSQIKPGKTKKAQVSSRRVTPLQFSKGPRPRFIYSETHWH